MFGNNRNGNWRIRSFDPNTVFIRFQQLILQRIELHESGKLLCNCFQRVYRIRIMKVKSRTGQIKSLRFRIDPTSYSMFYLTRFL